MTKLGWERGSSSPMGSTYDIFYLLPRRHQPSDYRLPRSATAGEMVSLRIGAPAESELILTVDGDAIPGIAVTDSASHDMLYAFEMPGHDVTVTIEVVPAE